jgi:ABC-2 type transport system ATP-binding protein
MEEVQALCARVGILDQGSLVACDSLTNLLTITGEPNLERVFLHLTGRALRD